MKIVRLLFLSMLGSVSVRAQAELSEVRTWIHLNGYTHHFAASDANNRLFGLGFTHYDRNYGRVRAAWEGDLFQDSACKPSGYLGRSWTFPVPFVSLGVTGAVMYHRNFAAQNRYRLLPVALPFLETRGGRLKVRAYYVPPVRRASDEQIALQLMLPWFRAPAARQPAMQ